jgi:hypothetical protein
MLINQFSFWLDSMKLILLSASFVVAIFISDTSQGLELITNGGFETGDFSGWTIVNQVGGVGSFYIGSQIYTPTYEFRTVGPSTGAFYAVAQQESTSTNILEQSFSVPGPARSVILKYDQWVTNYASRGPVVNPAGLDFLAYPNQHARVDIMTLEAGPFDTEAGTISNLYIGADPREIYPTLYTSYEFDITGIVGTGGEYKIRFANVNNLNTLLVGVDSVSIDFIPIPEPISITLLTLSAISALIVLNKF